MSDVSVVSVVSATLFPSSIFLMVDLLTTILAKKPPALDSLTDNTNKSLATLEGPWVHTTIIRYMHKIIIPRVVPITANILPIIVLTFFAVPVFFFFFLTMLSSILIPHYLPLLLF